MPFAISHGFIKGDTHRICEDYTTAAYVKGSDPPSFDPLIIVADGCSAVADADVGARIVALCARQVLTGVIAARETLPELAVLRKAILREIDTAVDVLGINRECCHATLLAGFVLDRRCHVYAFGDGLWYRRDQKGVLYYTIIEAADNMPPYLVQDDNLLPRLIEYPGGDKTYPTGPHFHWSFPAEEVVEFGIASDGIVATNRATEQVLQALTGGNVSYLLDAFLDTRPKCFDDLAIASIRIE